MTARLTRHIPERDAVVSFETRLAHSRVQPLPGDRFLVVGAWCHWRTVGAEENAQVIDSAGDVIRTAVLGDGILHVAATPSGQVWVGYLDEGVFGNRGWAGPGPAPVGGSGLVRFDGELDRAWEFPHDTGFGPISDCYALNVDGETAWACYYADFPVVRIGRDRVTGWTTGVGGPSAVITDGTRCALIGGYGDDGALVHTGRLTPAGRFEPRHTVRLVLPGGRPLPECAVVGRGVFLHVISGTTHHLLDLYQLPA